MKVPILLILYKKPETSKKILKVLKKLKVKNLYISLNIPKKDNLNDNIKHQKVVDLIKEINWDCKLRINKRKFHLSCYDSVYGSKKWFFKNEKHGIILEDDTLPSKSFFVFCEKLLKKYKNNNKISQISGTSFLNKKKYKYNYFFSNYNSVWGYATWRRSFKDYDEKMTKWPSMKKKNDLKKIMDDDHFSKYWEYHFDLVYKKKKKAYDYKWTYSNWAKNKIAVVPNRHLVQNIGFTNDGTHTGEGDKDWYIKMKPKEMKYLNSHPRKIEVDLNYDKWFNENIYRLDTNLANIYFKFKRKLKYIISKLFIK